MKKTIILIALITVLTGCFGKKKPDNEENKTPKKEVVEVKEKGVIENKEYSGIKIEDITFNYDGTYTNMSYNLINARSESITLGRYDVIVKDKDGNELGKLESYSPNSIEPNESLGITHSLDKDFSKAASVEFDFIGLNQ